MDKIVNEYTLYVEGIFNRNRKAKFESFKLAQIPVGESLNELDLDKLVQEKLNEIRLRNQTRCFVKVNELKYRQELNFQVMECKPFDAKLVKNYI